MLRQHFAAVVLVSLLMFQGTALLAQNPEPQEQQPQEQVVAQEQQQPKEEGTKLPPPADPAQIVKPSETASTPSTGRRIFTNLWSDQKAMWTSPFHINKDNAKWWALFAGSTAAFVPM